MVSFVTYHWEAQVEDDKGRWWCIGDPIADLGDAIGVVEKYSGHPEARGHLRVQQVIDIPGKPGQPGYSSRYIAMEA